MSIEEYILTNRLKKKLTQAQLARQINVSNTTISNYENGVSTPDVQTLIELSKIFDASLDDILDDRHALFSPLISRFISTIDKNMPCVDMKFVRADAHTQYYPHIKPGDSLFLHKIRKKPPNGALLLCHASGAIPCIYRLTYSGTGYLLTSSHPNKEPRSVTIKHLTSSMWEIKSVIRFL